MSKDTPGPHPRATDVDILNVLRNAETPVLTTKQVADRLPIKRRATSNRLNELEANGRIRSMEVGMQSRVWWPSEDDTDHEHEQRDRMKSFGKYADSNIDEVVESLGERGDSNDGNGGS